MQASKGRGARRRTGGSSKRAARREKRRAKRKANRKQRRAKRKERRAKRKERNAKNKAKRAAAKKKRTAKRKERTSKRRKKREKRRKSRQKRVLRRKLGRVKKRFKRKVARAKRRGKTDRVQRLLRRSSTRVQTVKRRQRRRIKRRGRIRTALRRAGKRVGKFLKKNWKRIATVALVGAAFIPGVNFVAKGALAAKLAKGGLFAKGLAKFGGKKLLAGKKRIAGFALKNGALRKGIKTGLRESLKRFGKGYFSSVRQKLDLARRKGMLKFKNLNAKNALEAFRRGRDVIGKVRDMSGKLRSVRTALAGDGSGGIGISQFGDEENDGEGDITENDGAARQQVPERETGIDLNSLQFPSGSSQRVNEIVSKARRVPLSKRATQTNARNVPPQQIVQQLQQEPEQPEQQDENPDVERIGLQRGNVLSQQIVQQSQQEPEQQDSSPDGSLEGLALQSIQEATHPSLFHHLQQSVQWPPNIEEQVVDAEGEQDEAVPEEDFDGSFPIEVSKRQFRMQSEEGQANLNEILDDMEPNVPRKTAPIMQQRTLPIVHTELSPDPAIDALRNIEDETMDNLHASMQQQ